MQKIATCCYCGTRAALVLRGDRQHELSCASCGAPLHVLKKLPSDKVDTPKPKPVSHQRPAKSVRRPKKKKRKKGLWAKVLDEAFDVVEDIFD